MENLEHKINEDLRLYYEKETAKETINREQIDHVTNNMQSQFFHTKDYLMLKNKIFNGYSS